jgi:hypothetical protein
MADACAPTDRLMQTLRTQVPGATDDMLELQLFNVVDEFLRRTNTWQESQDIELNGSGQYDLVLPSGAAFVRMLSASYNSTPVPSASGTSTAQASLGRLSYEQYFPDGDASFHPAVTDIDTSNIFSYAVYRPDYIQIINEPTEQQPTYPFAIIMALTVSRSCLECDCGDWNLPEWMFDLFFEDWLNGVLGRMYGIPAKPWTSPTHAQFHLKKFRNKMAFRKQEAMRGLVYNVPAWRFPRVGGWT